MKKQIKYLQRLFYDIWNDFGSVYLLVKYSIRTSIGKRGFTEEEKEQGLVLVFNNKTSTALNWDAEGNLTCVVAFGTRKENISIHHDDLLGVFSPEAGVQFLRSDVAKEPAPSPEADAGHGDDKQVVSISSFKKRKSKKSS
jgi:YD repeat-containing protein